MYKTLALKTRSTLACFDDFLRRLLCEPDDAAVDELDRFEAFDTEEWEE
jgi:hypothetical protein